MFFGLSMEKLAIIAIIAVVVVGPEKMPKYAAQLARLVKAVRAMANDARDRMREEMGPEFDDVDWKRLDPRQYDPRRIIREALTEDAVVVKPVTSQVTERRRAELQGLSAPYDSEST